MSKAQPISHTGIVERIASETIYIRIVVTSQCAACHAKSFCSVSDVAEKNIEVPNRGQNVQVGDEVNVLLQSGLGLAAVCWAYVFPLVILLAVLLFLSSLGLSELYSALAALGIIAVYYSILWFFRDKFKKKYTFSIESK